MKIIRQNKKVRFLKDLEKEWKEHWDKSSIEFSIMQIEYEDFYRQSFLKLFKKEDKVLEAGCGFGRYCFWFEKNGINAVGIDIVKEAIEIGKAYSKENNFRSKLFVGDICKLPFRKNTFNGYISLGIIEHLTTLEEINKAFSECYRVLKKGGKAFFIVPNPIAPHMYLEKIIYNFGLTKLYHRDIYKEDLIKYGKEVGFYVREVRIHDFYFPFYSIISTFLRRDILILKAAMKKILNVFDDAPILNRFGSGIAVIFEK